MKVFQREVLRQFIADLRISLRLLTFLQGVMWKVALAIVAVLVLRTYPEGAWSRVRSACVAASSDENVAAPVRWARCGGAALPAVWKETPVSRLKVLVLLLLYPVFRGAFGWAVIAWVMIPRVILRKKAVHRPRLVVTLVHGTFAADAPWTKAGDDSAMAPVDSRSDPHRMVASILSDVCCLERELQLDEAKRPRRLPADQPDREIYALEWTGENCHRARKRAADALKDHLHQVATTYPEALQVIVAHSHGGNVAMYALRDWPIATQPAVVTLSTPFLQKRTRDTEKYPWGTRTIPIGLLSICTAYGCSWLGAVLLKVVSPIDLSLQTQFHPAFLLFFGGLLALFAVWARQAPRLQSEIDFGSVNGERLLIVRTPGDEAGALLAVAQMFSILVSFGKTSLLKLVSVPYGMRAVILRKFQSGASWPRKVLGAVMFSTKAFVAVLLVLHVIRGMRERATYTAYTDVDALLAIPFSALLFLVVYFGFRIILFVVLFAARELERGVVALANVSGLKLRAVRAFAARLRGQYELMWKGFLWLTGRKEGEPVAAMKWFFLRLFQSAMFGPLLVYANVGIDEKDPYALLFSLWSVWTVGCALLLYVLALRLDDAERCVRWVVACATSVATRLAEGISVLPMGLDLLPVTLIAHVTPEPTPVGTVTAYTDDAAEGDALMHSRAYSDAGICYTVCHQIHTWLEAFEVKPPAAASPSRPLEPTAGVP